MRGQPRLVAPIATALLIASGCASQTPAYRVHDPIAEARCRDSGGEYQRVGMLGTWDCTFAYADGGRQCTDGSECTSSACIAELGGDPAPEASKPAVGFCQRTTAQFGCFAKVEDGKLGAALCVD